jgi:hypothetical protein
MDPGDAQSRLRVVPQSSGLSGGLWPSRFFKRM